MRAAVTTRQRAAAAATAAPPAIPARPFSAAHATPLLRPAWAAMPSRPFSAASASATTTPLLPSRTAVLFPGQGSQRCGPEVRDLESEWGRLVRPAWEELDESLQMNLSALMKDGGGSSQLQSTELAQPAILAHSYALWIVLKHELGLRDLSSLCGVAMGHSLGEYTALVVADALSFADGVRLVHARGKAMKHATKPGAAGMAALLCDSRSAGLHLPSILALLAEAQEACPNCTLSVANLNSPFQIVISGHTEAIEYVKARVNKGAPPAATTRGSRSNAAESNSADASPSAASSSLTRGILKCVSLDVSGPFHSPLMSPASAALQTALASVHFRTPTVPILFNVHSHPSLKSERFGEYLLAGLTQPVQWHPSICHAMLQLHTRDFLELGPSTPLASMLRSTASRLAQQHHVLDPLVHPADSRGGRSPHPSILPLIMPRPKVLLDDGSSLEEKDSASILAGLAPAWGEVRTVGVSSVKEMREFLQRQDRVQPVEV